MKKGLLSLLAVTLTIVSCQNYDDQFAELTGLVNTLSTEVAGIAQVKTDLGTLSQTVSGLATAASVAGISTGQDDLDLALASAQTTIDALTLALGDVASATELGEITTALAAVQADVKEILSKNAVINQKITINNESTLAYAETLISSATDSPKVIINGGLVITVTTTNFDAAQLVRLDALSPKIATVLGTDGVVISNSSTPVHDIDLRNLTFIDGPYTVTGAPVNDAGLQTITSDLTIDHAGAADYSQISTIGGNVIIDANVTSVDLSAATVTGYVTDSASAAAGVLVLAKATAVNVGTSLVQTATLVKAVGTVNLGHAGAITGDVVIAANKATRIDFGAKSITGSLTVGGALAAFYAPAMKFAGISNVTAKEAHFAKLTGFAGNSTITAPAVDFSSLSQTASGSLTLPTATALLAPLLSITNTVTADSAISVSVKTGANAKLKVAAVTTLSLTGLGVTTDFDTTAYGGTLVTLNVTAGEGKMPRITTVTNDLAVVGAKIATVNILGGDFNSVNMTGLGKLTSLSTAGEIKDFTLDGSTLLTAATIGHAHLEGSDAATFNVKNNPELLALTTSALDEVGNMDISVNGKLASIDLSSVSTLPILGSYTVTIKDNKLTGGFVVATAGATTTSFVEAIVKSNDLMTLLPYLTASAASAVVTYTTDINLSDVKPAAGAQDLANAITTVVGSKLTAGANILSDVIFVAVVAAE